MECGFSISLEHIGLMIYGITMSTLVSISFLGYFTFLRAIWGKKSLQENSIPLMSLCVSDLTIIFGHVAGQIVTSFNPAWPWGEFGCKMNAFIGMGLSFVSIGNIALLAYDTYLKETKSCLHRLNYGFYITAIWIVGLLTGYLPFLGVGSYGFESELHVGCLVDHTTGPTSSGNLHFIAICSVVWFFIPMYIITKYYLKLKRETGSGMYLTIVTVQMLISWTPYALTSLLTMLLGPQNVPQTAFAIASNLFAKICLTTNPYIYVIGGSVDMRVACSSVLFGSSKKDKVQVSVDEGLEDSKEK